MSARKGAGPRRRRGVRVRPLWLWKLLHRNYRTSSALSFWVRQRLTKAGMIVGAALVATGAIGANTNLSLAHQAFGLLLALLLVAVIWAVVPRPKVELKRTLPRCGTAGQTIHYRVKLRNLSGSVQRGVYLQEALPDARPDLAEFIATREPKETERNLFDRFFAYYRWRWLIEQKEMADAAQDQVVDLPREGFVAVEFELNLRRRGVLRLPGMWVGTTDPFGLFKWHRRVSCTDRLLVLPKRYPVSRVPLPEGQAYQLGGVTMASSVGDSEEFVALREYRYGDPLRRIHWRSWAKVGQPIVREYEDEFFVRQALLLDTFPEELDRELFEEAVSAAASFVEAVDTRESLLDLVFVGTEAHRFTVGRNVGTVEKMLEVLAAVEPARIGTFSQLAGLVMEHAGEVTAVICIFLQWDQERRDLVRFMRGMGVPMLVFVLVNNEVEPGMVDAGPMTDCPDLFHVVRLDQVAAKLSEL